MRLHQPTGIFLLLWPCWWAIGFATSKNFDLYVLALYFVFGLGSIIMRSAGCVINDIIDRDIDAKVERTKNRPLASGELKLHHALILLAILSAVGLSLLLTLNPLTIMIGCASMILVIAYPFMKRFTYWPQLFLALTFNIGAIMGWTAWHEEISTSAVMLYIAGIFWTLGYDTIYAHQDKADDEKAGVKSTALRFGKDTKTYVSIFYMLVIFFLYTVGRYQNMGNFYYLMLMFGMFLLFRQVTNLNIDNAEDCMKKFKSNRLFGAIIFAGIVFENLFAFIFNYLKV